MESVRSSKVFMFSFMTHIVEWYKVLKSNVKRRFNAVEQMWVCLNVCLKMYIREEINECFQKTWCSPTSTFNYTPTRHKTDEWLATSGLGTMRSRRSKSKFQSQMYCVCVIYSTDEITDLSRHSAIGTKKVQIVHKLRTNWINILIKLSPFNRSI